MSIVFNIIKSHAILCLAVTSFFYLSGCTIKALQLAEQKESLENSEYWKIKRVVSAVKQKNGDISVCVALDDSSKKKELKLNTIIIPFSTLSRENTEIEKHRLRPVKCPFDDVICYWYPIKKVKTGCDTVAPENLSSNLAIQIKNITVLNKDRIQLYNLLDNANKSQQATDIIYEVSLVSDKKDTQKEIDPNEAIESRERGSKDIILIYWPSRIGQNALQPISIAGAYEDNRTNLYYLLVPLAFVGDVVVVTVAAVVFAILHCPYCFEAMNY